MAIHFSCPVCRATYTVNDRLAGRTADCKACGQCLRVPAPGRTHTVLGGLRAPAVSPPLHPPPPVVPADPEPPDPLLSPPPPRRVPLGLIAFGLVGGVFLVACLGIAGLVLVRGGRDGVGPAAPLLPTLGKPSPDREGKRWEFADLVAYLKKNGYPDLVTEHGETADGWTLLVGRPPEVPPVYRRGAEMAQRVEVRDMGEGFDAAKFNRNLADDERLGNWAWGRFTFYARHPLILAKLRKALDG